MLCALWKIHTQSYGEKPFIFSPNHDVKNRWRFDDDWIQRIGKKTNKLDWFGLKMSDTRAKNCSQQTIDFVIGGLLEASFTHRLNVTYQLWKGNSWSTAQKVSTNCYIVLDSFNKVSLGRISSVLCDEASLFGSQTWQGQASQGHLQDHKLDLDLSVESGWIIDSLQLLFIWIQS